jgi:hypothetical protein
MWGRQKNFLRVEEVEAMILKVARALLIVPNETHTQSVYTLCDEVKSPRKVGDAGTTLDSGTTC